MGIPTGAIVALRRIVDIGLVVVVLVVLVAIGLARGAPFIGRQSIVIGGGSMEPTIGLGSAIVIHAVDPATLRVDDIVSMRVGPGQATFTHRIIAVIDRQDGRWIRTKGDANATSDPTLVPTTAVIGRVELVVPLAGYLVAVLSLPTGVMFVLGLAATLLAIAWLLESVEPEPTEGRPERIRGSIGRPSLRLRRPSWPRAFVIRRAPRPVSVARPTVREQLERSREVRNRRARWQAGPGHHRSATE
jgi:signal peptidase